MKVTTISLIFGVFLFSCQKHTEVKTLSWKAGDPVESLKQITDVQTTLKSSEIIYKGEKIQFAQQAFGNKVVDDTFVKKHYSKNAQIKAADAAVIDKKSFSRTLLNKRETNPFYYLKLVSEKSVPLTVRNYNLSQVIKLENSHIQNLVAFEYELNDGTLWRALFDAKDKHLSTQKLGSGIDAQVSLYTLGPKQSTITDVLLRQLDITPAMSNQSIFVDSEAPQKINEISPLMKFDPKDERFDQIQVFYYLDSIQTWMKNNLSVRFPEKLYAVVNVGYPNKGNAAFYFQNKIRLGRGDDEFYTMMASDPSVVYHEAFHALIDGLARLPLGQGEGGSLNEGFADFYTTVALNRPYLGEASYLKGPYKRAVNIEKRLDEKNGGLYPDSLILSSLLWKVKEKLGSVAALQLATDTLVELNPYSDFSDFNVKFLAIVDKSLSAEDKSTVHSILKERGFKTE